ncbi:hypothetical protein DP117_10605 [Brasilonema sp. UFV-L1]|nr:hypothetical protein [Brasilonema sp. UFV-L1]
MLEAFYLFGDGEPSRPRRVALFESSCTRSIKASEVLTLIECTTVEQFINLIFPQFNYQLNIS